MCVVLVMYMSKRPGTNRAFALLKMVTQAFVVLAILSAVCVRVSLVPSAQSSVHSL